MIAPGLEHGPTTSAIIDPSYTKFFHSSGNTVWLVKLSHQALFRPGITQNLLGLAGFFFKRFKTIFCNVETESIFIIFIGFLKYSP